MGDLTVEELGMLDVVGTDIERRMLAEIRRQRAMVERLELYIAALDNSGPEDGGTHTHVAIAAELRNRMKEPSHG